MKRLNAYIFILFNLYSCSSVSDQDVINQFFEITLKNETLEKHYRLEESTSLPVATIVNSNGRQNTNISFLNSNTEPRFISLSFPGTDIGTYNWSSSLGNILIIGEESGPGYPTYIMYDGQTIVTKYGSKIGVEGTISGTIIKEVNGDTLSLTGEFSAIIANYGELLPQ